MRGTGVEYRPICELAPDYNAKVPWVGTFLRDVAVWSIGLFVFIFGLAQMQVRFSPLAAAPDLATAPVHASEGEELTSKLGPKECLPLSTNSFCRHKSSPPPPPPWLAEGYISRRRDWSTFVESYS